MELWHVSDRTRCKQSVCRPLLQLWDEHRCHQSNTTVHQWSSYSKLQEKMKYNILIWEKNFFFGKSSITTSETEKCHLSFKWMCIMFFYLCNVHPAWSHDGYTLRTGHKDSPQDHDPSHKAVSMVTSGMGDSSCSGFSLPYGVPCPCPSVGTLPCSASSSVDHHPERCNAFTVFNFVTHSEV